jgi:hypothetical protein
LWQQLTVTSLRCAEKHVAGVCRSNTGTFAQELAATNNTIQEVNLMPEITAA